MGGNAGLKPRSPAHSDLTVGVKDKAKMFQDAAVSCFGAGILLFVFAFDGGEASTVEFEEFVSLVLSLGTASLLESYAGGLAVVSVGGHEFH